MKSSYFMLVTIISALVLVAYTYLTAVSDCVGKTGLNPPAYGGSQHYGLHRLINIIHYEECYCFNLTEEQFAALKRDMDKEGDWKFSDDVIEKFSTMDLKSFRTEKGLYGAREPKGDWRGTWLFYCPRRELLHVGTFQR